jgi:glycosyltransferase involved in cell wall biosynthesis
MVADKSEDAIVVIAGYARSLLNFRGHLLSQLVARGYRVYALAPDIVERDRVELSRLGVNCVRISLSRSSMNPFRDFIDFARLVGTLRRLRPQRVLSYTVKPVIYGSLAARLAGVQSVFNMITGLGYVFTHDEKVGIRRRSLRFLVQLMYRVALKESRVVFFLNPDDQRLFLQHRLVTTEQVALIHGSGVDTKHFRAHPPVDQTISFLLITRLLKEKGVSEYIEAARLLKSRHPFTECHLLGPLDPSPGAVHWEEIRVWIDSGVVHYHGAAEDVRPHISKASVYVLPSYREGTPRSVLEAMAMARPIVTTDVPGCRETVIDGQNGFLVPPRDPLALADAMEEFVRDPDLIARMGKESRKLAERKFDVHKVNAVILRRMELENWRTRVP